MSTLLIVDDEVFAVEGIKAALDWESLGIESIYTAFNVSQAKTVLQRYPIDLILCDIEMPGESGIDLLAWIRSCGMEIKFIFLTCHADFHYAQDAIRLRGFDYLLKPVPADKLKIIVLKAITETKQVSLVSELDSVESPELLNQIERVQPNYADPPNTILWGLLMRNGNIEKVRYDIRNYLAEYKQNKININFLNRFKLDFEQSLFSAFRKRGISAHVMLSGVKAVTLYNNAVKSSKDLTDWLDFSLDFLKGAIEKKNKSGTPLGIAKSYIDTHSAEKLDCSTVANVVGLHPDHLTRLFKKELGISVSGYIKKKKMEIAEELLKTTSLPVIEIADIVGYVNPAQFSTAFKKIYHKTPLDYRQINSPSPVANS